MRPKNENENKNFAERLAATERAKENNITGQARRDNSPVNYPSHLDRETHAAIYGRPGEFLMD